MRELGGIAIRVDQRRGLRQTLERLFPLAFGAVRGGQVAEQRGALGALRLLRQRGRGLVPYGDPVPALDRGLSRETVKGAALRTGQRLVANEVVEASPQARGDHLKRAEGGSNEAGLDLTNEALGQFVARKLGLAQA